MIEGRLSLGINVSILVILTIFGVLLSLPLRLLLDTNYYARNNSDKQNDTVEAISDEIENIVVLLDHRKLMRCPKFQYEACLKSVFRSDYDGNCTYNPSFLEEIDDDDQDDKNKEEDMESDVIVVIEIDNEVEIQESKEIVVAGHILVMMLLVSAIAAFVEVLRIRFALDKDSPKSGAASSRKGSTVDLPVQRRFTMRPSLKNQRSFEIQGVRPPSLLRRSSFPTQPAKQNAASLSGTPNKRMSRRQSAESDEEIGILINALHHRTRLIRRH
ncbi:hypothetical protein KM043_016339 [Ampulex compressa]|nr:hypothetical protein KM043_016339 [Ampulex compressa]